MGWHIRFAAFKGTGVSDRGDSIHRPFWSAFYIIFSIRIPCSCSLSTDVLSQGLGS